MHPTDLDDDYELMELLDSIGYGSASRSSKPNQPRPAPTTLGATVKGRTTSTRVRAKLKKSLEDEHGECFRTEIRDSGVFICGVHQGDVWIEGAEECPSMRLILDLVTSSVEAVIAEDELAEKVQESKQRREAAARRILEDEQSPRWSPPMGEGDYYSPRDSY